MNRRHQIWLDANELPGMCLADKDGNKFRDLLDKPAKLIHEFSANSNYEAMVYYNNFMKFGKYSTDFHELDSRPYDPVDQNAAQQGDAPEPASPAR
jgi:hypothetical protein